jgi:LPXTG-motif cell wall-anchored protein
MLSVSSVECGSVPSVCRRIAALLAVVSLGAFVPVSAALAQGAGDQQYQDPFAGSDSGSSGSSGSSKTKTNSSSSSPEPLTPSPQTSGTGSSGSSGTAGTTGTGTAAAPATPSTAPQATGTLPNTGLDTRVLLLAGAVVLLTGLGLRLRSAPERF